MAGFALLVTLTFLAWLFFGVPKPVENVLRVAEFAPCEKRFRTARSAVDSLAIDALVLTPRTRFTAAVTCGGLRVAVEQAAATESASP